MSMTILLTTYMWSVQCCDRFQNVFWNSIWSIPVFENGKKIPFWNIFLVSHYFKYFEIELFGHKKYILKHDLSKLTRCTCYKESSVGNDIASTKVC